MITTKTQSDFTTSIISSLLFSSMQNPTERYLSRSIDDKRSNGKIRNLTDGITKTLNKKFGLFKNNGDSLDTEVERAVLSMKEPENIINKLFAEETPEVKTENYDVNMPAEIKSAFKNLYSIFVGYAKSAYSKSVSGVKKVDGFVKITLLKLIRVGEYLMCLTTPHWNKVEGSPEDLDSRAHTISQNRSIDETNAKYESGHEFIIYQTGY